MKSPTTYLICSPQRIVAAACHYDGTVVVSSRHFDRLMHEQIANLRGDLKPRNSAMWQQGFIDQFGNFLDRQDALVIATQANQIRRFCGDASRATQLYSENLY